MVPIKIQCGCGQKYSFDVEPVGGRMPGAIACPICGVDGTPVANQILAQTLTAAPPLAAPRAQAPVPPPLPISRPGAKAPRTKAAGEFNMGLGILGAFLGALVGVGAMYGFYLVAHFRFPLLGVGIGALTGYGAKLLYKGTSNALGAVSAGIALVSVVGILFLMYGEFPVISIISVAVSVSVAYRTASG